MKSYASNIRHDVCDCCDRRGAAAITEEDGAAIFGICAGCDHDAFEKVARNNIDSWLAGDDNAFN